MLVRGVMRGPRGPRVNTPQEPIHSSEIAAAIQPSEPSPSSPLRSSQQRHVSLRAAGAELTGNAEVLVHIYDYGTSSLTRFLNSYAQGVGIFHTGIEVYGSEWCFGGKLNGTGVSRIAPRTERNHTYRVTVPLGFTKLTPAQVEKLVEVMKEKWAGHTYHMLHRNCNHFSDAMCGLLGCDPLPAWIFGVLQHTQEVLETERVCIRESTTESINSVVLGERAPLLAQCSTKMQLLEELQRATSTSCSGKCPTLSPGRSFCGGKENHQVTPLGSVSASIPTSPETMSEALVMGKDLSCSPRSKRGKAEGKARNLIVAMSDCEPHAIMFGETEDLAEGVPLDVDELGLWQQLDSFEHEPTTESEWQEALAADASVGALPHGGLPYAWDFAETTSDVPAEIDAGTRLPSFDSLLAQTDKQHRLLRARECKINKKVMRHELHKQAAPGTSMLLMWDSP